MVVSLAMVSAAVLSGHQGDLVVCVVRGGGDGMQWLFTAFTVPLKGDRRCAIGTTYEEEMISLRDIW